MFSIHELELSEQAGIQGLSQGPFDMIHSCWWTPNGFFCDQTCDLSVIGWYLKPLSHPAHVIIIFPVSSPSISSLDIVFAQLEQNISLTFSLSTVCPLRSYSLHSPSLNVAFFPVFKPWTWGEDVSVVFIKVHWMVACITTRRILTVISDMCERCSTMPSGSSTWFPGVSSGNTASFVPLQSCEMYKSKIWNLHDYTFVSLSLSWQHISYTHWLTLPHIIFIYKWIERLWLHLIAIVFLIPFIHFVRELCCCEIIRSIMCTLALAG